FCLTADSPKNPPSHSASSAHTYRLLVFKDRSAYPTAPGSTTTWHRFGLRRCISSREAELWRADVRPSSPFVKFLLNSA
ncbi:hypothetical protein, partial [Paraburkholderia ribeironis]|uniref:hypothetical protein n=1 Tax=Paraburkholderia ribeironis TaxID=1247936 RepID=UPI001C3FA596